MYLVCISFISFILYALALAYIFLILETLQSEVNILGRMWNPNLVKLLGYCWEDKELLLVYEFMQKGSLGNHLFRRKNLLELFERLNHNNFLMLESWFQCRKCLHRIIIMGCPTQSSNRSSKGPHLFAHFRDANHP